MLGGIPPLSLSRLPHPHLLLGEGSSAPGRRIWRILARSSPESPAPRGAATGVTRYEVMGTDGDRPALRVAQLSQASSGNPRAQPCGESRAGKALSKKKKKISQNPGGGSELTSGAAAPAWGGATLCVSLATATTPAPGPSVLPGEWEPAAPGSQ